MAIFSVYYIMSIDLIYAKITKSTDSILSVAEFVLLLLIFLHSFTNSLKTVVSKREVVYSIKEREMIKETRYNFVH